MRRSLAALCLGLAVFPAARAEAPADFSAIETGPNASLRGQLLFRADDVWSQDVSTLPIDPASDTLIASIGADKPLRPDFGTRYEGQPFGIPYVVIDGKRPGVPVTFEYDSESDKGPYPVPPDAPIEGGPDATGDRHVIVLDKDRRLLYELFAARPLDGGRHWQAGSGAVYDLNRTSQQRPAGWTSADAAGLPILPGLARYDEVVEKGRLDHALRFTVRRTRRAYVAPASHYASRDPSPRLPPMGMRVRLKASFDTSAFPPTARVILDGLKKHGMILADNGGDWFLSGAPNEKWNDEQITTLRRVKGSDFEVVRMGPVTAR